MSTVPTRLVGGGVAAILLASAVAPASAAAPAPAQTATVRAVAPAGQVGPRVPELVWRDCGDGLQCATARVPLDYDSPRGRLITLALARLPASDPQHRLGSLFVNPGGPGGSAVQEVRDSARVQFTSAVRARFDIVGMDPRGVGSSTPVRCFDTQAESTRVGTRVQEAPSDRAHYRELVATARNLVRRCAARNGKLLEHLSTANVARDLDLLRRAVGDRGLTYVGVSYGTYLGMTYAAMFPKRVRALVLDGNVDAPAYRSGGRTPFLRTHGAPAAYATLQQFFRLCARSGPLCAFGDGASPRRTFAELAARLRREPITLPGGQRITYGTLLLLTFSGLYRAARWATTAQTLQSLYELASHSVARQLRPLAATAAPEPAYDNAGEAQFAVACSETANPSRPGRYWRIAGRADRRYPYAGSWIAWQSFACSFWKARDADRYTGSFRTRPGYPALVMNNRHDPITPPRNAFINARLLAGSRVVTTAGYGHTVLNNSGPCDTHYRERYLIDRELPPPAATCGPGVLPFR